MAKGKQITKFSDFQSFLPEFDFAKEQMDFFRNTLEIINTNKDTSKVTCFPTRCGIGKSTFIKAFMRSCISESCYQGRHEPQGIVIITDSIKRLEELSGSAKEREEAEKNWGELFIQWGIDKEYRNFEQSVIVLRSGVSFLDQLKKQYYKPIVLLSTQRYFMLSEQMREQLFSFKHKNKVYKRNIVIFDECPYFYETVTIDSDNLTRIESALYKGLSDEVKDKEFVIREFKTFKDRLLAQMDAKEKLLLDQNVTVYWKDKNYTSLTPNDELFFEVIKQNSEPLIQQYNPILKDLDCLKQLAKEGAIFNAIKKRHGNYERSFILIRDNKDYFYLGGDIKFFVFDATADIDPRYDVDYVEKIDGKQYNIPLKMTITNVNMPTSKRVLCNGRKQSITSTKVINDYINEKIKSENKNALVVSYSEIIRRFEADNKYLGYFGNLKGFNDYKDICQMAHIGMNRFPTLAYFLILCSSDKESYCKLADMTEEESMKVLTGITTNTNEAFKDRITNIMLRSMLADFEQNIFRLAIRKFNNEKMVNIWTFYNKHNDIYNQLTEMICDRYKEYDVKFIYEDTPENLCIEKVKERKPPKGKEKSNSQKIIDWYEMQEKGREVKLKDILSETGINNQIFKDCKKDNKAVKAIFEKMKTNKKGYYKVC